MTDPFRQKKTTFRGTRGGQIQKEASTASGRVDVSFHSDQERRLRWGQQVASEQTKKQLCSWRKQQAIIWLSRQIASKNFGKDPTSPPKKPVIDCRLRISDAFVTPWGVNTKFDPINCCREILGETLTLGQQKFRHPLPNKTYFT